MARAADLPGAAHLVLAEGVVHLDPASAVFEAMREGWARQQRTRFPEVGLHDQAATVARALPGRLLQPVPVGVAAGAGGGLFRPCAGEQPEPHRFDRASVSELAADVLRLHLRRPLRMARDLPGPVRAGADADPARAQQHQPRHRVRGPACSAAVDLRGGAGAVRRGRRQGGRDPKAAAQGRTHRDAGLGASKNGLRLRTSPPGGGGARRGRLSAQSEGTGLRSLRGVVLRFGKSSNGSPPKRRTVFTVPEMDWMSVFSTTSSPRFGPVRGRRPSGVVADRAVRQAVQARPERGLRDRARSCPPTSRVGSTFVAAQHDYPSRGV